MPEQSAPTSLMPSVLDRLIDPESAGTAWRQGYSVQQMIDAVRADLEDLLNTRQSYRDVPPQYPETVASVLGFGLPDLVSMPVASAGERTAIGVLIEILVARYEPRLRRVRVTLVESDNEHDRQVRFHIDAKLAVEPAPEVGFVTVLELSTGQASVVPRSD